MRVLFLVPYFGKLPNYFSIFLQSCAYNPRFEWMILTDDTLSIDCPDNVHLVRMSFDSCRNRIQECFDFPILITRPQKLCDYKCAYGYIFQDYLDGYDWWGYCDLDQIFGNLGAFITDEMLNTYDKIGSLGHLSLYRNRPDNNRVFMSSSRYKEVFTTKRCCAFDEWLPGNINELYLKTSRNLYLDNVGADVNPYHKRFQLVNYDIEKRRYVHSMVSNSIFNWNCGILKQVYLDHGELQDHEFPYIHLQKRTMKNSGMVVGSESFYIVPNRFVVGNSDPLKLMIKAKITGLVNSQFISVKWKSLKYRIKCGDWSFSNVFH